MKKSCLAIFLTTLLAIVFTSCEDRIASRAYKNLTTISYIAVNDFVDSLKVLNSSFDGDVSVEAEDVDSYFGNGYGVYKSKNIYSLVTVQKETKKGKKSIKKTEEYELIGFSRQCDAQEVKRDAFLLVAAYPKGVIDEYCNSHYNLDSIAFDDNHSLEENLHRFKVDKAKEFIDSVACTYMNLYSYYGHRLDLNEYNLHFLSHKKYDIAYVKVFSEERLPSKIWDIARNVSIFGTNIFGGFKFIVGIILVLIVLVLFLYPLYSARKETDVEGAWDYVYEMLNVAFSFLCGIAVYSLLLYWNEGKYWQELSGFVKFLCWISIIVFVIATILLVVSAIVYYIKHKSLKFLCFLAVPLLTIPATLFLGGFLAILFYSILILFGMKAAGRYSSNSHFYPPVTNNLHVGDIVEYKGNHFEFLGYGGSKHWKLLQ